MSDHSAWTAIRRPGCKIVPLNVARDVSPLVVRTAGLRLRLLRPSRPSRVTHAERQHVRARTLEQLVLLVPVAGALRLGEPRVGVDEERGLEGVAPVLHRAREGDGAVGRRARLTDLDRAAIDE